MNWDAIGAVGESLGAIAVLITLIYLAIQIRQNTAQQKREELVSIWHGQNALLAQLGDPKVMGAYVRTAEDKSPTIEDRGTSFSWVVQYLNHFHLVHELHGSGSIEDEQYELWVGFAVATVAPKGIRRWWDEEQGKLGWPSEVRSLIDKRLQDSTNPPIPITEMWSQWSGEAWQRNIQKGTS